MENNNWRAAAPGGGAPPTAAAGGSDGTIDTGDWRALLQPESRQRIVNKIMDTLKRHLPFSGQEGLQELKKIAVRFEGKIYTAATSQSDYLRKISLKMLTMESKSQNTIPNSANGSEPPDQGAASHTMQPPGHNQGQSLPIPLPTNQSQPGDIACCFHTCGLCVRTKLASCSDQLKAETSKKWQAENVQVPQKSLSPLALPEEPIFSCPICLGNLTEPTATKCGHIFCKECIIKSLKSLPKRCPTCRKRVAKGSTFRIYLPTTN